MGELIRKLGTVKIGKTELDVELNKGTRRNAKYDIHIQSPNVRLCITEKDFCKLAADIIYSNEKLHDYKSFKDSDTGRAEE
jgi:hypothetical protein